MKERPILFSAPMVRALLADRKTQTRRIISPYPHDDWVLQTVSVPSSPVHLTHSKMVALFKDGKQGTHAIQCPYGQPGDRLWVKETWRTDAALDNLPPSACTGWPVRYEADGAVINHGSRIADTKGKTRVSIHMPRWASRISLEIVNVRAERLQDISETDAIAEGCPLHANEGHEASPVEQYRHLWNAINGAGNWDTNPWVWVVEFYRVHRVHT